MRRPRCAGNWSAGSARSPPMVARESIASASRSGRRGRSQPGLPAIALIGRARLLHRRERLLGARGLGARAVSRGSLRRGPRAGDRHAAGRLRQGLRPGGRRAALPRLHDAPGAAPELRRVARAARGLRLARARLPGAPDAAAAGGAGAGAARADPRRRARPRAAARRSPRRLVTMLCASRAHCSARGPICFPPAQGAGCRSSGAQASRRSTSMHPPIDPEARPAGPSRAHDHMHVTDDATRTQDPRSHGRSRSPRPRSTARSADLSPACAGAST